MANQQAKKSGNSAKIGRHKRAPSNAQQIMRTARNGLVVVVRRRVDVAVDRLR